MLSLRNRELEERVRTLAARTGKGMTELLLDALKSYDGTSSDDCEPRMQRLRELCKRCAALPDIDTRSAEDILGYSTDGVF